MLSFGTVLGLVITGAILLILSAAFIVFYMCCGKRRLNRKRNNGFKSTNHFSGYMTKEPKKQRDAEKAEPMYAKINKSKIKRSKHEENLSKVPDDDVRNDMDDDGRRPTSLYEDVDTGKQILSVQDLLHSCQKYKEYQSSQRDDNNEDSVSDYSESYPEDGYSTRDTDECSTRSGSNKRKSSPESVNKPIDRQITSV